MNKKQCREALDIYKKFIDRTDRVSQYLKIAEVISKFFKKSVRFMNSSFNDHCSTFEFIFYAYFLVDI